MTALVVILFISDVLGMVWCLALRARIERLEVADQVRNVRESVARALREAPQPGEIVLRRVHREPILPAERKGDPVP